jgi:hypothetical protein
MLAALLLSCSIPDFQKLVAVRIAVKNGHLGDGIPNLVERRSQGWLHLLQTDARAVEKPLDLADHSSAPLICGRTFPERTRVFNS